MNTIGIDIGIRGGIALVNDAGAAFVMDTPTVERKISGKTKRRVDAVGLSEALAGIAVDGVIAFVERAQASPQMGVSSAFAYGEAFGLVVGVLAQLGVQTRLVSPVAWKREMGLMKPGNREIGRDEEREKDSALELARKLYPQLHASLNLAKHDGRADALLIAHYGAEILEQESAKPTQKEIEF